MNDECLVGIEMPVEVEELLVELLTDNGFYFVESFADAGLLTLDNGVFATTIDGAKFQITITRSA